MLSPDSKSLVANGSEEVTTSSTREPLAKRTDSVSLIYIPLHLGGAHRGVSMGPAAMKVAELSEKIQQLGYKVADEIDVNVPNSLCWIDEKSGAKCVPEIGEVSMRVAEIVEDCLRRGTIPITIGGDHSLAIGSLAGVSNYYRKQEQNFGLVWFDAHGDINTPDTSLSGNVHGMPLAVSLGVGDERLTDLLGFSPKVQPHRSALIGIRDLDQPERDLINQTGITPFTMRDIDHLGVGRVTDLALGAMGTDVSGLHLSFDIDVIDPGTAPGVSTAARGGLSYRESLLALTLLAESQLLRSIDIAEVNPAKDIHNQTAELAVELVLSCLGKRIL
ncbi:MAG: arginase [Cyanobacteria bacterium HKST-UBA02]|nr:arginase [Cyanobacteria bacterium HKST-UBA02]